MSPTSQLAPFPIRCPFCATGGISIARLFESRYNRPLHALLQCANAACSAELPLIDGLPVLMPDPRRFIAENAANLLRRSDCPAELETLIGECAGPGLWPDAITSQLSSYCWGHYGDLDPDQAAFPGPAHQGLPHLIRTLLSDAASLGQLPDGPVLDLGCAVGGGTLTLASTLERRTIGIDINIPMLRLAHNAIASGTLTYPLRRNGLLYTQRTCPLPAAALHLASFMLADASQLPFPDASAALIIAFNTLDSTASPLALLAEAQRVLKPGGRLILTCPFDWSGAVTPPEAWLGGHSPRSTLAGDPAKTLRAVLTPGAHQSSLDHFSINSTRDDLTWSVRHHDRSTTAYTLHTLIATRR